jgi:hypothetical protein
MRSRSVSLSGSNEWITSSLFKELVTPTPPPVFQSKNGKGWQPKEPL